MPPLWGHECHRIKQRTRGEEGGKICQHVVTSKRNIAAFQRVAVAAIAIAYPQRRGSLSNAVVNLERLKKALENRYLPPAIRSKRLKLGTK